MPLIDYEDGPNVKKTMATAALPGYPVVETRVPPAAPAAASDPQAGMAATGFFPQAAAVQRPPAAVPTSDRVVGAVGSALNHVDQFLGALQSRMFPPAPLPVSGGPDRPTGVGTAPGMPSLPNVVNMPAAAAPASQVAKTPRAGGGGAAAPAQPAQPALVPGETGFYFNNELVPYGTMIHANIMPSRGLYEGAGSSGMIDPRDFFKDAVAAQGRAANQAADAVITLSRGNPKIAAALANVYAQSLSNIASSGMGGANALNNAIASITGEGIRASASTQNAQTQAQAAMYGSNNSLTGDLARANATVQAARVGAAPHEGMLQLEREKLATTPVPIGQEDVKDQFGQIRTITKYGMRNMAGGMPSVINAKPEAKPVPGLEYTDARGNRAIYQADGTWKPVK